MKKVLKRRNREQKTLQLYGCVCISQNCKGCGTSTADDYVNVKNYHTNSVYVIGKA